MELLDWIAQKDHLLAILVLLVVFAGCVATIINAARGRNDD